MRVEVPVITIDAYSRTAAWEVAGHLSESLGWRLLDGSSMFHLLALAAKQHGVGWTDEKQLEALASNLDVSFHFGPKPRILLEGEDVTHQLSTETAAANASIVMGSRGARGTAAVPARIPSAAGSGRPRQGDGHRRVPRRAVEGVPPATSHGRTCAEANQTG
ncbi:hypothetical protein GCM10017778_33060 [Streptomyces vinaceus]|nr:hypothetical protein GCM10017778_33060 [Streptomyces vinaceus]